MAVVRLKDIDLSEYGFDGFNERSLRTLYERGRFGPYRVVTKAGRKLMVDTEVLSRWWEWYRERGGDG